MSWLLALIPGGKLTAILGSLVAGLLVLWRVIAGIKQSGVNEQLVKEANARDQNLARIKRAIDARAVGGVQSDPNNRDNQP